MRLLIFHVDRFTCTLAEPGRSPLREPADGASWSVEEGLLVLAQGEAEDEPDPDAVGEAAAAVVAEQAARVRTTRVLLLPFAHLFGEPGRPEIMLRTLEATRAALEARGLSAQRPPYGWFYRWDLQAKGHPLSRVARQIRPPQAPR